jgi:DNA-binding NarL/FixJ family response regulator
MDIVPFWATRKALAEAGARERLRNHAPPRVSETAPQRSRRTGLRIASLRVLPDQLPRLRANGLEAIAAIRADFPAARIIVLTTYKGDVQALRALKAGASGFPLKNPLRKEMMDSICTVHMAPS